MKFKRIAKWIAGFILFVSTLNVYGDWIYFGVNQGVPDNDPTGYQNTQTLTGLDPVIESIEVSLRLSGSPDAFSGDYYVSLIGPNGGFAVLLNRVGRTSSNLLGYGDNGFDITFALGLQDVHLYQNGSPDFDAGYLLTGGWGADGRNVDPDIVLDTDSRTAGLDVFNGLNPNGNWTLFVADLNQYGTATVDSWGLNISTIPEPSSGLLLAIGGVVAWLLRFKQRF
ncbi:MAG: PEP-CTERM sorting domain-containing protein [Verrucomicrobia bacterium]|nr:PEP-CTERM sorting domain-containing protein [Verrucomicrobiota bacterium]